MFSHLSPLVFTLLPLILSSLFHMIRRALGFLTSTLTPRILVLAFRGLQRPFALSTFPFFPDSLRCTPCALFFFLAQIFFFSNQANSAQVTLQWDPSTDPSLAGYKIHYGYSSHNYTAHLDVGKTTIYTVANLQDGVTYYFAASAYDASLLESNYSDEVVYAGSSCTYSLSPTSNSFTSAAGTGSVNVAAGSGCSWTANSNASSWIIITSNSSGTGTGAVNYSVLSNTSSSSRNGTMTIANKTFTVSQAGAACTYSLSSTSATLSSGAGTGNVSVTAPTGCSWTASSNASWITVSSGSSGSGNGSTAFSVTANTTTSIRTGTLTIAGKTFTVNQSGISCTYSLSPTSASVSSGAGTGNVSVTAPGGCSWTASSNASWITVSSGSSGSGNGTTAFSVIANSSTSSRTGTLTVAGKTFTVNRSGLSQYTLTLSTSGTGSGTITTSPQGTIFDQGTVVTLTAVPADSSNFAAWSGGCAGTSSPCSLTINSNTSVTAAFNLKTFTIDASAGQNGSISPAGTVTDNYGATQSFTIAPVTGYNVSDVKVDGTSVGAVNSYLFGNLRANHSIAATFAAVPPPSPSPFILALDAGGPEFIGTGGIRYQADQYFTGGATKSTAVPIKGTQDVSLYQTERYGNFSYAILLPNGNYDVTLKFVENTYSSKGQRVFNVYWGGYKVIGGLDIFSVAGKNTALDITFTVNVLNGILPLKFVPRIGDAQISGILINKASSPPQNPWRNKRYFTTLSR